MIPGILRVVIAVGFRLKKVCEARAYCPPRVGVGHVCHLVRKVMEETLQHQKESMGFQDSDIDDLRRLISDTNVYLLAVTLVASTLHLLFEVCEARDAIFRSRRETTPADRCRFIILIRFPPP